jgi:hypothetical protein
MMTERGPETRAGGGAWWSIVAMGSLALAGCSKPPRADRLPTYPVAGHVFDRGQPAAGAQVQLWAVGGDLMRAAACPHATVEADGSFRLTTYETEDGAPPGEYGLTLRWPLPPPPGKEEGPDRFQGRYADPARPLRQVRISANNNELAPIQLE